VITDLQLMGSASDNRPIDLGRKLLLPGFVEAHVHLDK
jgi:cytosine/adenosine deaminase-related metal-dependent hydrolase